MKENENEDNGPRYKRTEIAEEKKKEKQKEEEKRRKKRGKERKE